MKKLFIPLSLIAVFSCGQQEPINSKAKQSNSKFEPLLAQFKDIGIDTLQVYSTQDSTDIMSGRAIDSIGASFFPEEMAQAHFHEPPSLFAIYKFSIDKNRLGLLARTPSEYVPSSIKLFIFDSAKDSITSYIELGETIGDAGDYMIKNTWIFKDTSSKHLQALVNITQGHDNSVDNPKDTTVKEDEYYSLLDLSKPRIDTIFADKEQLPNKYKMVVRDRKRLGL
ncbi:hypothetical protein A3860_21130 [Niastella vici]|uniref:Lipoprotein n=1 Tax=Niastella vici TaxID=1703345 RepID=A0A1V9G1P1_9BACT|nr:hypothetical protein [Niastella vici]OQP64474.1 hypothetical protein A3860_21130 [Niastella vici]